MSELVRGVGSSRAWSTALLLVFALAGAWLPWPWPAVTLGLVALVAIAGALAAVWLVAGVRADRGELMAPDGTRYPVAPLRTLQHVEQAELWIGVALAVLAAADAWHDGRMLVFVLLVPTSLAHVNLGLGRGYQHTRTEIALADQAREPVRVRRLARSLANAVPALRAWAEVVEAYQLLKDGDVEAGAAQLIERWNGALDNGAVTLVLLRLHRGDPSLAERWLAVERPSNRSQRYFDAVVQANVDLCAGRPEAALAAVRSAPADLPRPYLRDLRILEAAALRATGREEEASDVAAGIDPPLATEPWRASTEPLIWTLVTGAPAPAAAPARRRVDPAPSEDAFAPPAADEAVTLPRAPVGWVGAIPGQCLPLDGRPTPRTSAALAALAGLLVVSVAVAVPRAVTSLVTGEADERAVFVVVALGAALAAVAGLAWELRAGRRPTHRSWVRLSDGRSLGTGPMSGNQGLWWLAVLLALVAWSWEVSSPGGRARALVFLGVGAYWATPPLARMRQRRVVRAAHDASPDRGIALARRALGRFGWPAWASGVRVWLALSLLRAGRAEEAERELAPLAPVLPEAEELRAWFRAGRGDVDLDHLLQRPEPDGDGPAYRHAVACALAALRAGRADRVLARTERWTSIADALPNPFGALLHHLVLAVLVAARDPRADSYRAAHPEVAEAAWVAGVWPFARAGA